MHQALLVGLGSFMGIDLAVVWHLVPVTVFARYALGIDRNKALGALDEGFNMFVKPIGVLLIAAVCAALIACESTTAKPVPVVWERPGGTDEAYQADVKACVDEVELELISEPYDSPIRRQTAAEKQLLARQWGKRAYEECLSQRGWTPIGDPGEPPIRFYH